MKNKLVIKRYENYRPETQDSIKLLVGKVDLPDEYIPTLDLIATNYDLLFEAREDIRVNGAYKTDGCYRSVKSHYIQILYSSQSALLQLLKSFPTNPMSKARIDKMSSLDASSEDFMDMVNNL